MFALRTDRNIRYIFGITLMAVMGVSSIVPALPGMVKELDMTPAHVGWVISVFTLPGVFMAPFVGVFADRVGRRVVLVPSLFIFALFGAACFWAGDLKTLLWLRFFQGIGAGALGVLFGVLIGDLYEGDERTKIMGFNSSVLAVGTAGFPFIGGMLAMLGWNWPFLLPLAAIPLGLAVLKSMEFPSGENVEDFSGYFNSVFQLLKKRQVLSLIGITFLVFVVLYGPVVTYLPVLLHGKYALTSFEIGTVFFAFSLCSGFSSAWIGPLSGKFGDAKIMGGAAVIYCLTLFLMPEIPGFWWFLLLLVLLGAGRGLLYPLVMNRLASLASNHERGALMAVNSMLLRLAQTLAPIAMGAVFAFFGIKMVYVAGFFCSVVMLCLVAEASKR